MMKRGVLDERIYRGGGQVCLVEQHRYTVTEHSSPDLRTQQDQRWHRHVERGQYEDIPPPSPFRVHLRSSSRT